MMLGRIRSRLLALVLAAVAPFTALIGVGLWSRWHDARTAAIQEMLNDARLLAAQVDDHIGNVEHLIAGLSRAVSANPADTNANDALLRQVKAGLPGVISNILVVNLEGTNIGTSSAELERPYLGDRRSFRQVLAGQRFAIGDVTRSRMNGQWVVPAAGPVEDRTGRLVAVLVVGTKLAQFQDALRLSGLRPGSAVRIIDDRGTVVAQSQNGPNWIGRDLSNSDSIARHMKAKETSEVMVWSDGIERITGSSTAHRVPWLVSVGLPTNVVFATLVWHFSWGALLSALALVAAFTIAWIYSGRVVRPLLQLENDMTPLRQVCSTIEPPSTRTTKSEIRQTPSTAWRLRTEAQGRIVDGRDNRRRSQL